MADKSIESSEDNVSWRDYLDSLIEGQQKYFDAKFDGIRDRYDGRLEAMDKALVLAVSQETAQQASKSANRALLVSSGAVLVSVLSVVITLVIALVLR
jgi:hypothetical protein